MISTTLPAELSEISACNLQAAIDRVKSSWNPPESISTIQWMEEHFRIPKEDSDIYGRYDSKYVPYFWGIAYALDSPRIEMVILMKAAQIGWTLLETGWLAKLICVQPSRILALFPKDDSARKFFENKFEPAIESTPELAKRIDISGSRKSGNRANYKKYPGGDISGFGSNSVSNVKSTPAPTVLVEEPDDTNTNVGDQGSSITLAKERIKRWRRKKFVLGGTPSVAGFSIIEDHSKLSSQRVLPVECHECGKAHPLEWENVSWVETEDGAVHPVYGRHKPETAAYACPDCGSLWSDYQRKQNVINTCKKARDSGDPFCGWVATVEAPETIEGFIGLNELYVCLPGTSLADVVRAYLEAEVKAAAGDESDRIVFINSKLAKPYEYSAKDRLDASKLQELADDYEELVCPAQGMKVTAGVDVQHDRLAVVIRAWGRNEESWLLYWGELSGEPVNKLDPCWDALDKLLLSGIDHERFGKIFLDAVSIDSSDGGTNQAVYTWVRTRSKRFRRITFMAIKGDSHDYGKREIFQKPRTVGHTNPKKATKADKHEIKVYLVGTHKAKDVIAKRLVGTAALMHSYRSARPDYWEQVTAESKMPSSKLKGTLIWQCLAGRRNEGLDCEVYALHAAQAINIHTFSPKKWDAIEQRLSQNDLFKSEPQALEIETQEEKPTKQKTSTRRPRRRGGFVSGMRD